jgi:hypothetical protein
MALTSALPLTASLLLRILARLLLLRSPPAYAGTDFLIARDGRIAALPLFRQAALMIDHDTYHDPGNSTNAKQAVLVSVF